MTISLENKLSRAVACVAALLWLFATAGQAVERQKLKSLLLDDPATAPLARLTRRTFLPVEVSAIYASLGEP